MRLMIEVAGVLAVASALMCGTDAVAQKNQPRQYYDKSWTYNKKEDYYYKTYHYKCNQSDTEYKKQYVVYKPSVSKDYVYWNNPETKTYWARCPTVNNAKYGAEVKKNVDYWSLVKDDKKKEALSDYQESDYKAMKQESPYIPGSTDKTPISCPPIDLPKG